MTDQLEQELRHLFAADADRAPMSAGLGAGALRRVRQRRRAQLAWVTGAAAATVVVVAVVSGGLLGGQRVGDQLAYPPATSKGPLPTPTGTAAKGPLPTLAGTALKGPLDPGGAGASCVQEYSLRSVTGRTFAFDGTVSAIGPARSNRPGAHLNLVAATFTVNHWYQGGSGSTVTVDFTSPEAGRSIDDSGPSYGVGSRLLVSGEPRWGGAPLTDAMAWGCGFTRYYDKATADNWRAAFG